MTRCALSYLFSFRQCGLTDTLRTFDLFSTVGMTQATSLAQAQLGQLVPYYMQNVDSSQEQLEYFCYNDVVQCGSIDKIMPLSNNDPFNMNVTTLGIEYVAY